MIDYEIYNKIKQINFKKYWNKTDNIIKNQLLDCIDIDNNIYNDVNEFLKIDEFLSNANNIDFYTDIINEEYLDILSKEDYNLIIEIFSYSELKNKYKRIYDVLNEFHINKIKLYALKNIG